VSTLVTEPQAIAVSVIHREDVDAAVERFLFEQYGVGDLAGVEGAQDRVVELSERSSVACPLHARRLVPDACRSCRFLAGEVQP
jgi:hypothetical protein